MSWHTARVTLSIGNFTNNWNSGIIVSNCYSSLCASWVALTRSAQRRTLPSVETMVPTRQVKLDHVTGMKRHLPEWSQIAVVHGRHFDDCFKPSLTT